MIEPTKEEIARLAAGLEPAQFLQLDAARFIIAKRRLAEQKAELKITDDQDGVWPGAIDHNLTGVEHLTAVQRVKRLTYPLAAIDGIFGREQKLKVLCVGPRTEMELMVLWGMGFRDVRGLDLISYSPYVDVGNIMNAPYPDNTFDIVIVGWVLVYTSDPLQACREISRIAKPRGIISVGSTYWPPEKQKAEGNGRGPDHYPLADELLQRFPVGRCFFRHETPNPNQVGRTIVIFEQNKT